MKKKFTLLITVTALLLGGSGGKVWGQAGPGTSLTGLTPSGQHHDGNVTTEATLGPADNNFGPGEAGTIKPLPSGHSTNAGAWSAGYGGSGNASWNPFYLDNGRITVGGTNNLVEFTTNLGPSTTSYGVGSTSTTTTPWTYRNLYVCINQVLEYQWRTGCSSFSAMTDGQYWNGSSWVTASAYNVCWQGAVTIGIPSVPDGTGIRTSGSQAYDKATYIYVDGQTKTSNNLWELEQLYFMDNPWRSDNYNVTRPSSSTHSIDWRRWEPTTSSSIICSGTSTPVWGGGGWSSTYTATSTAHENIKYDRTTNTTAYLDAYIAILGGSQINLTGDASTAISGHTIGVGSSLTQKSAYFTLPNAHYTLMIDNWFDETSISAHGGVDFGTHANVVKSSGADVPNYTVSDVLGVNAVLGIFEGYSGKTFNTNASGGTILLGTATVGQNKMVLTTTGVNIPTSAVAKQFQKHGTSVVTSAHGTSYYTMNGLANVGNYGDNNMTLDNAAIMFANNVGTAGWQIFNQSSCSSSLGNLTFNGTDLTVNVNSTGSVLIDATGELTFKDKSEFNATGTGHTTIRGGRLVQFEKDHTYAGQNTGDYWVQATGGCTPGDIITLAAAPAIVSNLGSTGDLKWQAYRDVNTKGTVQFTADQTTAVDWIATTRNIYTENTVDFAHSGSGQTKWYAKKNIWTEKAVNFSQTSTGATYWHAEDENIEISKATLHAGPLKFEKTHASSGYTEWRAGNNIITRAKINFINNGSGNTKWLTDNEDILTYDWVDFLNTSSGNTDWHAHRHITTNDTVTFTNTGTGNTKWWAETGNITTNKGSENGFVTFNNSGATGANTDWWAGQNILTNNVVTFNNAPATVTDAYIKWWAQNGNIELNDSTIFNQLGTASTASLRGVAQSTVPSAGSLWLLAQKNILSENGSILNPNNEEPLIINYSANNNAPIKLQAVEESVILDGVLHVDRQNTGTSETTIEAGRDIHFLDTATLFDKSNADILLHAHRDIRVNDSTCSNTKTAPVTFEVTSNALTRWIADRNIHTRDTVNFKYNSTGKTVNDLHLVAQGGNIKTERWFNIDYDSNNKILFSAVDDVHPYNYAANPGGGGLTASNVLNPLLGPAGRFVDNGNIWFNDSMKITRSNTGAGITDILAKYNIRTAMVDYMDSLSTGNNTTVESYMGDIFLGYSTEPDNCNNPDPSLPAFPSGVFDYDTTRFKYTVLNPVHNGLLDIKAGFEDAVDNNNRWDGGNIYFTHIDKYAVKSATSATKITIPFSNEYKCTRDTYLGSLVSTTLAHRIQYEHSGIIGGVGPCGIDLYSGQYDPMQGPTSNWARDTSLIYRGNKGSLLVDAGLRGNIIMNRGTYLNFQDDSGNTEFRTREGNIDMRYPFNADSLRGSLLFLASSDLPNKQKTSTCDCDEVRNNVYLQDFKYYPVVNSGSIFVGADNNIKLQYGGLKTIGTNRDPFFSPNDDQGYPCGKTTHCDSDTTKNLARELILNFSKDSASTPNAINSGGFAAVASDLIDVYKTMIYTGGKGSGMSAVPGYGSLHGEAVVGYGLYIKTQADKSNWGKNAFDAAMTACMPEKCDIPCDVNEAVLQNTARVTFHSDARIYTEGQRSYIGSPVLETFGNLDLNTHNNKVTGKTAITIQTDSLIVHDSLIIDGKLTNFTTWSGLYRDMPIIKLGHHRFTPPFAEDGTYCKPCFYHEKGTGTNAKRSALDTLYVTYRNGASMPRLHTLVADHTVLSFLTDSFDHVKGDPTINAKFYTDTFKVRNHVEMYKDKKHERDGHFELISEEQMESKDYAGIYARHLHMEPIAPKCGDGFKYSQLWLQDPALDVITSSTFGGYGWIHADVHVEIDATLAPGFASLREKGNYCYELMAGTLKMQDLRLDKGSRLRYTIGDKEGFNDEKVDVIEVDEITMYGSVNITVEKRCGQKFEPGCYPIIRYNSVAIDTVNLNNLQLETKKLDGYRLSLDTSIPGTVYLCVGEITLPQILRQVFIPETEGVTTKPGFGAHYIASMDNFKFTAKYTTPEPLKVLTNRMIDGSEEELTGTLNANGEYEYVIRKVQQNIVLKFGPDFASDNELIDGRVIWAYNNTIYFRVEKEDIASIYSIAGQLVRRIDLPEGDYSVPMERGVYIVTLKDGSVHKVILK